MDKFNRVMCLVSVSCCLLLFTEMPYSAEVNWYKIELIGFEQESTTEERFRQRNQAVEWPQDLQRLNALDGQRYATVAVDSGIARLFRRLERSTDHAPLWQLAWTQPVEKDQSGKAVRISKVGFDGYVRLQRGTYLHLVVEMKYAPLSYGNQIEPFERNGDLSAEVASGNYHLKERRRILLNDVHYFDHPKFGVITKVSLLEVN